MSECLSDYFIKNEELLVKDEFKDSYLYEGISLYEVIRVIDKVPLFLNRHLNRLLNSAEIVNKEIWFKTDEIKEKIIRVIEKNHIQDGNVKIVFNIKDSERNFYGYFIESHYPTEEQYKNGVNTIFCFMERSNPTAKIMNKELREITNRLLQETGSYEAILVDKDGMITEGSRSNIFMVQKDRVLTAPLNDVLPGITREIVIETCSALGIIFEEKRVNFEEIKDIDALFISGTSPKILPINKIHDFIFSSSTNMIVQNIMRHYNRSIIEYIRSNKIN